MTARGIFLEKRGKEKEVETVDITLQIKKLRQYTVREREHCIHLYVFVALEPGAGAR